MEDIIRQLIDLVQQTAPEVWAIGLRQAVLQGVYSALFCLLFLGATFLFYKLTMSLIKHHDKIVDENELRRQGELANFSDWDKYESTEAWKWAIVGSICGIFFTGGFSLWLFWSALAHFINPGYYAIQALVDLL